MFTTSTKRLLLLGMALIASYASLSQATRSENQALVGSYYTKGTVAIINQKYATARMYLDSAATLGAVCLDSAKLAKILTNQGRAYLKLDQYQETDSILKMAIAQNPNRDNVYADANIFLAELYARAPQFGSFFDQQDLNVSIAQELQDSSRLAQLYSNFAIYYLEAGNNQQAMVYLDSAESIQQELGDSSMLANTWTNRSDVYSDQGQYQLAINLLLQALAYYEAEDKGNNILNVYQRIANIYLKQENPIQAGIFYRKGIAGAAPGSRLQGHLYNDLGRFFSNQGQPDSARMYYQNALEIWEAQEDPDDVVLTAVNLAELVLETTENLEGVRFYFQKAASWLPQVTDDKIIADYYLGQAAFLIDQGELALALNNLEKSAPILNEIGGVKRLADLYDLFRTVYREQHDFDNYLLAQDQYEAFRERQLAKDQQKIVHETEVRYETEKKQKEIELNKATIEWQDEELKLQRKNNLLLTGLALILALLIAAMVYAYRVLRSRNELIRKLNTEINHRTLNHLAFIQKFYSMEMRSAQTQEQKAAMRLGMTKLESMVALYRKLYNDLDEQKALNIGEYLQELSEKLMEISNLPASVVQLSGEDNSMDVEEIRCIGLVVTELVTNSVKYGTPKDGELGIRVTWNQSAKGEFCLTISDNGPGLSDSLETMKNKSFGLKIIYLMVEKQLKGQIDYTYAEGAHWRLHWKTKII